jgi:hypothetical protein
VKKKGNEDTYFRRFKRYIENLYDTSRTYRDLVYLSKIIKMMIYFGTGFSIILVIVLGKRMSSLEDLVNWMSQNYFGKFVAVLIAFGLMIYGLEKLR